ncbi:MAG: phosphoribosylanthranilate isomerase [Verrucomicrobiota bacterium]
MANPIIQIAGIRDQAEADLLLEEGVAWLGFPLRLAVHQEDLSEEDAARIIRGLKPPARGVLITYLSVAEEVVSLCDRLGTTIVQLHGDVPPAEAARLKELRPEFFILKSLVVGRGTLDDLQRRAARFAPHVDAFITDTYDPATGASGATGRTHDWSISRKLVASVRRPVILAGGLNPENVRRAILEVRPTGVDAHTGVEGPDGRKDRGLVRRFVKEASAGFASAAAGS